VHGATGDDEQQGPVHHAPVIVARAAFPAQTPGVTTPWFLIGCGYTGERLARALIAAGDYVTIARRDRAEVARLARDLGANGVHADLADPATLLGVIPPAARVVCLAPPGPDPAAELRALGAACAGARRLVYVSSTGVYAPGDGGWVDERWPIAPTTAAGRARVVAEAALAELAIPWIALRVAGIRGPGRGLIDRIRAGTYRVIGDGTSHVSRIHVDDLVAAIIAAGRGTARGHVNVADDDPAPIGEVADAIAAALGVPPPPRVPLAEVSPELAGMLGANRRIANERLKRDLGVTLRHPSWRDVYD
jgi:nucleoside-diphosphate-sugar epimerase